MFEEGRRHMGSVVKRLSSVAWRKTVGLSVVSVLVVSVIAIAEIGVLNDATVVAAPAAAPACDAGYGAAGLTDTTQSATVGGHGCVVIEYVLGGTRYFETFNFTGADQTWTVPAGVTAAKFTTYGAGGGGTNTGPVRTSGLDNYRIDVTPTASANSLSWYSGNATEGATPVGYDGGAGGSASAAFVVTPGEELTVIVGERGIGNSDDRCLPVVTRIGPADGDPADLTRGLPNINLWPINGVPSNTDENARHGFGGGGRASAFHNTRAFFPVRTTNDSGRDHDECINPYFAAGGGRSEVTRGSTRLIAAGGGGGAGFYGAGGNGATLPAGSSTASGADGAGPPFVTNHPDPITVSPTYGSGGTGSAGGARGLTSNPLDNYTGASTSAQVFAPFTLFRSDGFAGSAGLGGQAPQGGGGGGGGCFGGGGGGDGGGGGGGSSCVAGNQLAPPTASGEAQSVVPGGSVTFTTLTGSGGLAASPAGFDTASTCLFDPGTTTCNTQGVITIAGEGTYTLDTTTGVVTFVADPNATLGAQTPISYQVTDAFGQTQTATLTVTTAVVIPPPPAAVVIPPPSVMADDEPAGAFGAVQVIAVLANDSAGLDASTLRLCPSSAETDLTTCTLTSLTVAGEGTYTVNADGTVTFVPDASFVGLASSVRYVVADSDGQFASAKITLTVHGPTTTMAVDDEPSGAFGAVQVIEVLANDAAASSAVLDASTLRLCASSTETDFSLCSLMSLTVDGEGTYTVNADGTVTFVPDASFVGVASPVRYVVADSDGQFASARITLTVHGPNPLGLPRTGTELWEFLLLGVLLAALGLLTLSGDLRTGRPRRASLGNGRS